MNCVPSELNQLGSKCEGVGEKMGGRVVPGIECVGLPNVTSYKL